MSSQPTLNGILMISFFQPDTGRNRWGGCFKSWLPSDCSGGKKAFSEVNKLGKSFFSLSQKENYLEFIANWEVVPSLSS